MSVLQTHIHSALHGDRSQSSSVSTGKSVNSSILWSWLWTLGRQHPASSLPVPPCHPSCRMFHCKWGGLVRGADVRNVESSVRMLSDWVKSVHPDLLCGDWTSTETFKKYRNLPFADLQYFSAQQSTCSSLRRSLLRLEAWISSLKLVRSPGNGISTFMSKLSDSRSFQTQRE